MPLPDLQVWNSAIKKLNGSNLSSNSRSQLKGLSGEVQGYLSEYEKFMAQVRELSELVERSKQLEAAGANPKEVTKVGTEIQTMSTALKKKADSLKNDAPKMGKVVGQFGSAVAATDAKNAKKPLSQEQVAAQQDCVDWLKGFEGELMSASTGGFLAMENWVTSALGEVEVYGKANKGPVRMKFKNGPGGGSTEGS
jgi:hypothetical protein